MGKKAKKVRYADAEKRAFARTMVRRRLRLRLMPAALGASVLFSWLIRFLLQKSGLMTMSGAEELIVFLAFPVLLVVLLCLAITAKFSEMVNERYDDINDRVQRIAIGHYNRLKKREISDELTQIYDGLDTIVGQLIEKNTRIESIGKKCDQLENAHEGETCRWLGAKVNPEMVKTVLAGIEKMAAEGRNEDILEILDDAKQVIDASLEDGVALRPLADELSRIKRFLEIYEAVYQRKIGYRMSIMCNIVNYRIIPNLVLPVVQILFDRAMASQCEDYEIGVEVNSSFNNLLIIVRDNYGLKSEEDFSYMLNDDAASRAADDGPVTIGALNRRISSFYGKKYTLKLSSTKLGTAVYIYLPPVSNDNASSKR